MRTPPRLPQTFCVDIAGSNGVGKSAFVARLKDAVPDLVVVNASEETTAHGWSLRFVRDVPVLVGRVGIAVARLELRAPHVLAGRLLRTYGATVRTLRAIDHAPLAVVEEGFVKKMLELVEYAEPAPLADALLHAAPDLATLVAHTYDLFVLIEVPEQALLTRAAQRDLIEYAGGAENLLRRYRRQSTIYDAIVVSLEHRHFPVLRVDTSTEAETRAAVSRLAHAATPTPADL